MLLSETEFRLNYLLNKKELSAVNGDIQMTQELFNSIVNKMTGRRIGNFFEEFITKYQDFLIEYCEHGVADYDPENDAIGTKLDELWEDYYAENYPDPYIVDKSIK